MAEQIERLVEWIRLVDVPKIVETLTSHRFTRQTINNWVRNGWLKTQGFYPRKTTMRWIRDALENRRKV